MLPLVYFYETIPHSRCRKLSKCTLRSDFSQFLFQKVKFTSTCESVHELPYLLIKLSVKYFISKLQRHHVQSVKNTSNQVPRRKESGKVRNFLYVLAIKNFFSQQRMISAFRSTTPCVTLINSTNSAKKFNSAKQRAQLGIKYCKARFRRFLYSPCTSTRNTFRLLCV